MYYFIDYENVSESGLEGITELNADDTAVILCSTKNNGITLDWLEVLTKMKAQWELVKGYKVNPNYMDFWVVCEISKHVFTENINEIGIVSGDKGFISVQDYFERLGKKVYIGNTIRKCQSNAIFDVHGVKKEEKKENKEVAKNTTTTSTPEKKTKPEKSEKKPVSEPKIKGTKRLTASDKDELRKALKNCPNKLNGTLNSAVFDTIESTDKLGMVHYNLIEKLGRLEGTRAYKTVYDILCDIYKANDTEKEKYRLN